MTTEQNKSPPTHSATPFWIDDDGFIASGRDDTYKTIADSRCLTSPECVQENDANAAFIVHACNSHYDLLNTLDFVRGWFVDNNFDDDNFAIFEEICASIAKARGQQ